jgi:hypothetical protein
MPFVSAYLNPFLPAWSRNLEPLIPVDQKPWLDQAARNASYMLASNIHPKVVQERLGHSSIAITMDICRHLMPNMQGEAAAAVDGALRAAINKRADDVG